MKFETSAAKKEAIKLWLTSAPRLGSGRDRELSNRDDRRLRSVGKECSRREGMERGNQKYRELAEAQP